MINVNSSPPSRIWVRKDPLSHAQYLLDRKPLVHEIDQYNEYVLAKYAEYLVDANFPTKSGYYWFQSWDGGPIDIVYVYYNDEFSTMYASNVFGENKPLSEYIGTWDGPLTQTPDLKE